MQTILYDAVKRYCDQAFARFHMPGHKGIASGPLGTVLPLDITEVEGADSLFHADGPIAALEQQLADLYGAKTTLLSAGGATLCIQAMLALACGTGAQVIMSRNIHRSAINACALLDLDPVWVYPQETGGWFPGRYGAPEIDATLCAHPAARAVYLTSPDYFGGVSDLAEIAAVCRKRGVFLLVDNAHGAHLPFVPASYGVPHPLAAGASACADSLHKTMPAMTGGALLHLANERLCGGKEMMSLFGSTSPSYPIMLSCEQAAIYAETCAAADFARTAARLDELRGLALQKGYGLPAAPFDPAKLSLAFGSFGVDAATFGGYLREHGVEPEYVSETACVLMANGLNTTSDFQRVEQLLDATPWKVCAVPSAAALPRCEQVMRVREAVFAPRESVAVSEAVGRVAALEASPCPPGIPLVMSGECISAQAAEALAGFGVAHVWVVQKAAEDA